MGKVICKQWWKGHIILYSIILFIETNFIPSFMPWLVFVGFDSLFVLSVLYPLIYRNQIDIKIPDLWGWLGVIQFSLDPRIIWSFYSFLLDPCYPPGYSNWSTAVSSLTPSPLSLHCRNTDREVSFDLVNKWKSACNERAKSST